MPTQEYFAFKSTFTGGTEIMAKLFHDRVGPYLNLSDKFNCILLPGILTNHTYESILYENREILLWLHNNPNEFLPPVDLSFFRNPELHNKLRKVITVSHYAAEVLGQQSGIPTEKIGVIYNVVPSLSYQQDKFKDMSCVRMVWCKTPERGLDVALNVLHARNEKFILDIFGFENDETLRASISEEVMNDERFSFHGRQSREVVLHYMQKAHMFIYPATWYETFCISLAEALSAGCICVYNNIGSLKEIGMNLGFTYQHDDLNDDISHRSKFNEALSKAFEAAYSGKFNPEGQIDVISRSFSVENFVARWFSLAAEFAS